MGQERQVPAPVAFLFTLCNVLLALVALLSFSNWQAATTASAAAPGSVRRLHRPPEPVSLSPTVCFVASQEQAHRLETFLADSAPAGSTGPWVQILVVSSDAEAGTLRQVIAARNLRRAAAGRTPIRIIDVRSLDVNQTDTGPTADPDSEA
jgi:hypothetical protein